MEYGSAIYDHCVRMLSDRSDAEDAVQDTFTNAFKSFDTFTYGDNYLPWLYRIATNACLKRLKKRMHQPIDKTGFDVSTRIDERVLFEEIHARNILLSLLKKIDERKLQILSLYYLGGMNQQEIADSLGVSRRTVINDLDAIRSGVAQLLSEETS